MNCFTWITSASNNGAFMYLRRKYLFREEGVTNLIWIPSILAVFKNSFWHYAYTCGFLIFFFFLEIETLTPYPSSSFPPITVSIKEHWVSQYHTVSNSIKYSIRQYQNSIRQYQNPDTMYQNLIISESDTIRIWYYVSDSDTVTK